MRLQWINDIHLNFLSEKQITDFFRDILDADPDALLIGGDIHEASGVFKFLRAFEKTLRRPIYFVLGNHDYYGSSIAAIREKARILSRSSQYLYWLPDSGVVRLTGSTGLIGHGAWADGRFGDFLGSNVNLNDYHLIKELSLLSEAERLKTIQSLGDEAADYIRGSIGEALEHFNMVYFLTHVPPFREATIHAGEPSDDNWAPHFSCRAVGDVLIEAMSSSSEKRLIVLCGHTHGEGRGQVLPNLEWITGGAEYGQIRIQKTFETD